MMAEIENVWDKVAIRYRNACHLWYMTYLMKYEHVHASGWLAPCPEACLVRALPKELAWDEHRDVEVNVQDVPTLKGLTTGSAASKSWRLSWPNSPIWKGGTAWLRQRRPLPLQTSSQPCKLLSGALVPITLSQLERDSSPIISMVISSWDPWNTRWGWDGVVSQHEVMGPWR